ELVGEQAAGFGCVARCTTTEEAFDHLLQFGQRYVLTVESQVETGETQAACAASQGDQPIHHSYVLEVGEQQRLRACCGEVVAVELVERFALLICRVVEREAIAAGEQGRLFRRQRRGLRQARAEAVERLCHLALIRREVGNLAERRACRGRRDIDRHAVSRSDAEIVGHRERDDL